MNFWDILILLIIAGIIGGTYYLKRRRVKQGRGSCCQNCRQCKKN